MTWDFIHLGLGRWLHIGAGVMWIGLLYYFNFVNVAAAKAAAADGTAAGISKHVMPRALLFFRWAAVVTWLAGAFLLGEHFVDAFAFRARAYVPIGIGAWLGTAFLASRANTALSIPMLFFMIASGGLFRTAFF